MLVIVFIKVDFIGLVVHKHIEINYNSVYRDYIISWTSSETDGLTR